MNDLAMWSVVAGFLAPLVVAAIQQPKWSSSARAVVTFLFSCVVGGGTAYFEGNLTGQRFVTATLLVLVTAISTYKGFWQPTGAAPAVEKATSPTT